MFTPHVTLAKNFSGFGGIPPSWINSWNGADFGDQTFKTVQLLAMDKPLTFDGYYAVEAVVNFNQDFT